MERSLRARNNAKHGVLGINATVAKLVKWAAFCRKQAKIMGLF